MSYAFAAINPFRKPTWRWDRASTLFSDGANLSRRKDDAWTGRAYRFIAAQAATENDHDTMNLINRYPHIFVAHSVYTAHSEAELMLRNEIEARLLSGQDIDEISVRSNMSRDAVIAFEKLFFNVSDRLHNRSYIVHQVIGPDVQQGLSIREPATMWKLFGYFCGPLAVDLMVDPFLDPERPLRRSSLKTFCATMLKQTLTKKAFLASQTLRASASHDQLELIEKFLKLLEIENHESGGADTNSGYTDGIKAMLDSVPWSAGHKAHATVSAEVVSMIRSYDMNGIELSPEELLQISIDGDGPSEDTFVGAFFPPKQLTAAPDSAETK